MLVNEASEEFFVTVTSHLNGDVYKSNKNFEFFNFLWQPVKLQGDWQVGLVNIDYADDFSFRRPPENPYFPDRPQKASQPSVASKETTKEQKYENFYGNDNKIEIASIGGSSSLDGSSSLGGSSFLVENSKLETMTSFLAQINVTFLRFLKGIASFNTDYELNKPPRVVIDVYDEDYVILFPKQLSSILGFGNQTRFSYGTSAAIDYVSEAKVKTIKPDDILDFKVQRWDYDSVSLPVPKDIRIDSLVQDIALAMEEAGFEVEMGITPNNYLKVSTSDENRHFKFKLPPAINSLLNLDSSYYFENTVEILLENSTKTPEAFKDKLETKREEILQKVVPSLLLIETNIVTSSLFGKSTKPVLKIIKRDTGLRVNHFLEFSPVEYKRVRVDELCEILIKISTLDGKTPKEILYPTTLTLHFKKYFGV